jgi:hypothetical protein
MYRGAHNWDLSISGTCMYLILCMSIQNSMEMLGQCQGYSKILLFCLYLLTLPETARPYVRSAHEGHFPHVYDSASMRPVIWVRGSMLQHVLGASAVRITDNRIRFIPAAWTLVAREDDATKSTSCFPHISALCSDHGWELRDSFGMGEGSLVFPIAGTEIRVHGNTSHSCKNGIGRTSEASDMVKPVYDVSVCDVVDGPLDILFVHDTVFSTQSVPLLDNMTCNSHYEFVLFEKVNITCNCECFCT